MINLIIFFSSINSKIEFESMSFDKSLYKETSLGGLAKNKIC